MSCQRWKTIPGTRLQQPVAEVPRAACAAAALSAIMAEIASFQQSVAEVTRFLTNRPANLGIESDWLEA